jgi:hypothetical protein
MPIGGAGNVGSFLDWLGPRGFAFRIAGLYDIGEEGDFR